MAALLRRGALMVNPLHERCRYRPRSSPPGPPTASSRWSGGRGPRRQPWLYEETLAAAGCEVSETVVFGDHMAVFGRVVHVTSSPTIPLLYGMREFSTWVNSGATAVS
ncbi:flavin reductase [Streptomyces atratus]|uniref:flavin reductase n=1 Tax=Streptomyces atratus TaxID=1893 RepID=UPI00340AEF4C